MVALSPTTFIPLTCLALCVLCRGTLVASRTLASGLLDLTLKRRQRYLDNDTTLSKTSDTNICRMDVLYNISKFEQD